MFSLYNLKTPHRVTAVKIHVMMTWAQKKRDPLWTLEAEKKFNWTFSYPWAWFQFKCQSTELSYRPEAKWMGIKIKQEVRVKKQKSRVQNDKNLNNMYESGPRTEVGRVRSSMDQISLIHWRPRWTTGILTPSFEYFSLGAIKNRRRGGEGREIKGGIEIKN